MVSPRVDRYIIAHLTGLSTTILALKTLGFLGAKNPMFSRH
jgi:hypothetical protein